MEERPDDVKLIFITGYLFTANTGFTSLYTNGCCIDTGAVQQAQLQKGVQLSFSR